MEGSVVNATDLFAFEMIVLFRNTVHGGGTRDANKASENVVRAVFRVVPIFDKLDFDHRNCEAPDHGYRRGMYKE
jgi:hypothetical protein